MAKIREHCYIRGGHISAPTAPVGPLTTFPRNTSLTDTLPDGIGKHLSLYPVTVPVSEELVTAVWRNGELPFYIDCLWNGQSTVLLAILRSDFVFIEGVPYVDVVAETIQRAHHLLDEAFSYLNITEVKLNIIGAGRVLCSNCNFPLSYPNIICAHRHLHASEPPVAPAESFISDDEYLYFVVTEMDGSGRLERLGVSRLHYVDNEVARSWATELKQKMNRLGPVKGAYAGRIIDSLHREMNNAL